MALTRMRARFARLAFALGITLAAAGCAHEARPDAPEVRGPVRVENGFDELALGTKIDVAFDATSALTLDDVRAGKLAFEPSHDAVPSRGLHPGTFWAKVTIDDTRSPPQPLVLEQRYAQSDVVTVHEEGAASQQSGDHVPFADWAIRAREPAFLLAARARHELIVELRGDMTKQLPLTLRSEAAYREHVGGDALAQGLYFGSVLSLVLYNLFLFVGTREKVYGLYAATIASYVGSQLAIHGVGTQRLWGQWPGVNDGLATAFSAGFCLFGTPFFRSVLDLDERRPRVAKALGRLMPAIGACIVLVPFLPNHIMARMTAVLAIAWAPTMFALSAREAMRGDRVAVAVTLAWLSLLGGLVLYAMRLVGLMPTNALTVYATQVGSVLEAILLSFALAGRLKRLQHEVVVKGELALANASEALVHAERARAASDEAFAARELAMHELDERRRLQGELDTAAQQLTQAENMATLGMLMAGIAHDLRNPLNYVQGAAEQLREAIPSLRSGDEAAREKSLIRVEKVVGWVEQGTASMDAISLAMRNQARGGGAVLETMNLRDVVNEALLLCKSRLAGCDVNVAVQNTTIVADPTGVGQLVMNLVSNAADALKEAHEKAPRDSHEIRVVGAVADGQVILEVHDSGPGIPEQLRAKILEPFFTTKPRGQGTGLGLAIVQRVVKQHGGSLQIARCDALGGASFLVRWGNET